MALVVIPRQYATRAGIQIRGLWLADIEYICPQFGVKVSSGYRTRAENQAAGGAPNSDHLRGDAADFVDGATVRQRLHAWAVGRYPYVEPTAQAPNHVHISFRHNGISEPRGPKPKRVTGLKRRAAIAVLRAACSHYAVDWMAAAAVAFEEGASGKIGDSGTSYGPWQMHIGGALPRRWWKLGKHSPKTLAWAWSKPGFWYAIKEMAAAGARGKRGHAAIDTIVNNFERPKDKAYERKQAKVQYDWLAAKGSGAAGAAAEWFFGPSLDPVHHPPPPPPPPPPRIRERHPAGVEKAWHGVIAIYGIRTPAEHTKVRKLAASLKDIFRR